MKKLRQSLFAFIIVALGMLPCTTMTAQQYVNHVLNAGFNVDKSDWEFEIDGQGFASVIDPTGGYYGTGALHTGFETRVSQIIDLSALGFSDELLDKAPIVRFSTYAKGTGSNVGDQIRYNIELRDASGSVVETSGWSDWFITTDDWQEITHNFINYGPGVRSIYFSLNAWDQEANTTANEGVLIDAVNLSINNHMMYTNAYRTGDLTGWENIVNGGDGWAAPYYFRSSYETCTKGQTINLMDLGYSAEALDSEPVINVWEFILGHDGPLNGTGIGDTGFLNVELRDASGNVIESSGTGDITCTDSWQLIDHQFNDYGTGLREIYVEHGGADIEFWAGQYGHEVDASTVTLEFCNGFDIVPTIVDESEAGLNDGSIDLAVSGGVGNYTYTWDNGANTATIDNLAAGTYEVTISDEYGCTVTEDFTISLTPVGTKDILGLSDFTVSPNPTSGMVLISIVLETAMEGSLAVYDIRGKLIESYQSGMITSKQYDIDLTSYPAGVYVARLILNNQVATNRIIKN